MKWICILGATMALALMSSAAPMSAAACDSCWGVAIDTPITRGISLAMLALIGTTSVIWGGIGAFFLHVHRRARLLEPGETVVDEFGEIRSPDESDR